MTDIRKDPLFDNYAHLATFPDHILRDVARNDCAEHDYRLHAVEVLVGRKSSLANHPDLADLRSELAAELDGIQFEYPDPEEEAKSTSSGPLSASVTTKTMFANTPQIPDEVIPVLTESTKAVDELTGAEAPSPDILQARPKRTKKPKDPPADVNPQ